MAARATLVRHDPSCNHREKMHLEMALSFNQLCTRIGATAKQPYICINSLVRDYKQPSSGTIASTSTWI